MPLHLVLRAALLASLITLTAAGPAAADTRYYLLQSRYEWSLKATEDATTYNFAGVLPPLNMQIIRFRDPLDLTVLLRVDDLDSPGRKARVTFYFQSVGYRDELRAWTVTDFTDGEALRRQARQFVTQPRTLTALPMTAAYEEEALACLLLASHGAAFVIDLDVTPDMPDPLVYQADALVHDVAADDPAQRVPRREGVAWFESDAQMLQMQHDVLAGPVPRVERLRHLLWGQLKVMAMYVENHRYAYFRPHTLTSDAPALAQASQQMTLGGSRWRSPDALVTRRADIGRTTPALAFPALYRWASMSDEDFARTLGQAGWRRVETDRRTLATPPDNTPANRRAENAADRLEATRQSLGELAGGLVTRTDAPERVHAELTQRERLGARYLETLTRIHGSADEAAMPAPLDHGWAAALPMQADDDDAASAPPGGHGLWLASMDRARFQVNDNVERADVHRISHRATTARATVREAPLLVPGLASDRSATRIAIVDVEAVTLLEARRLTPREAEKYLPAAPAAAPPP